MKIYPIAEIFTSPQGEGVYTGALMTFIRLAGCTVGKPFPKEKYATKTKCQICGLADPLVRPAGSTGECCINCAKANGWNYTAIPVLPIYTEMCTLYDGRTFECDTDYRVKERLTADQIVERIPKDIRHVCLTGGEPLMHDLNELIHALRRYQIHIETSGTIIPKQSWWNKFDYYDIWVTVSPKRGVLKEVLEKCNEVKLLVDENFDILKVPQFCLDGVVFIQPVNFEHKVNTDNLKRCLELQKQYPHMRISTQMHKIWDVR